MPAQSLTLGIETSGWSGSIALVEHGGVLGLRRLDPSGRRHARTLVPEIESLLRECGRTTQDLRVVAVSIGPGSFTGLRVGVVCAKTLAWAAQTAVVAVDTYLAIASQTPTDVAAVQVTGDGQRGDLYVGRYHRIGDDEWRRDGEIQIHPAEDWLARLSPESVVTGPGLDRHAAAAARKCRILPPEVWTPQAATIARLGERQALAGRLNDLWTLEPFYLRRSSAEENADTPHPPLS